VTPSEAVFSLEMEFDFKVGMILSAFAPFGKIDAFKWD
jgi:hypothetical protein